jgi:hypothetical protein
VRILVRRHQDHAPDLQNEEDQASLMSLQAFDDRSYVYTAFWLKSPPLN